MMQILLKFNLNFIHIRAVLLPNFGFGPLSGFEKEVKRSGK